MPRLSKKLKQEYALFLNPNTGKRQYNLLCQRCIHDCKQSFLAKVLVCGRYRAKAN